MSTELIDKLAAELEIPEGVTVTYDKPMITVQGPLGKTWKSFVQSTRYKRQESCNNEYIKITYQKSL